MAPAATHTHDQSEALGLSDRIIVLNKGSIAQIGTPRAIYNQPENEFVADFVGTTNLLGVEFVEKRGAGCLVRLPNRTLVEVGSASTNVSGADLVMSIRPERILVALEGEVPENLVRGSVTASEFQSGMNIVTVDVDGSPIQVETRSSVSSGPITLSFPKEDVLILSKSA
ncbi:hypothetical protein QCN27_10235 [Cereibacter sp. SYSU M97828]|nr:hypothetical protein [Cereibacter flavus]